MPLVQIQNGREIRVFPYRTRFTPDDELAFIGEPPLFRPQDRSIPVRISVVFKWWRQEAERLARAWRAHYDDVQIGGPAYGDFGDAWFTLGKFLKLGCIITSRGCVKHCGWCPEKNRQLVELPIGSGWTVQDSNLLACSERHIRAVFDMLREQPRGAVFSGGLDKHFLMRKESTNG